MKNLIFRMNDAILHRENLHVIVSQFVSFKKPPRENWAKGKTQKGVVICTGLQDLHHA